MSEGCDTGSAADEGDTNFDSELLEPVAGDVSIVVEAVVAEVISDACHLT